MSRRARKIYATLCRNPRCSDRATGILELCPACRLAAKWGANLAFLTAFLAIIADMTLPHPNLGAWAKTILGVLFNQ